MGEAGSGKTTLLEAFVDYLEDMDFDDPWRYKSVDENEIKEFPPGESVKRVQLHLIMSIIKEKMDQKSI